MARPTLRAPKTTATGGFAATALYATSVHELTPLWRRAAEPAGAHDLAARILGPNRYAHTRGVAQQAARLARATRLERAPRSRLLSAAWLHDLGHGIADGFPPLAAARALRRAGHEQLARLVAHACGADLEAALRGLPPITRELPAPGGQDAALLSLVDIADLTTSAAGTRIGPAARLRELSSRRAPGDPALRVLVAQVARLADDPTLRTLVEHVVPRAHA
jgi:HD domain